MTCHLVLQSASLAALKPTICRTVSFVSRLEYVMLGNALHTTDTSITAVRVVVWHAARIIKLSNSVVAGFVHALKDTD